MKKISIILAIIITFISNQSLAISDNYYHYSLFQGETFSIEKNKENFLVQFINQKINCSYKCFLTIPRMQESNIYDIFIDNKKYKLLVKSSNWKENRFTIETTTEKKLYGNDVNNSWDIIGRYIYTNNNKTVKDITENFLVPTTGRITMDFGEKVYINDKFNGSHFGIDFGAKKSSEVKSTFDGIVVYAGETPTYGNILIIDHGLGIISLYAHLEKIVVNNNQIIKKGDYIADVGSTGVSTGPHLHFTIFTNGIVANPKIFFDNKNIINLKLQ